MNARRKEPHPMTVWQDRTHDAGGEGWANVYQRPSGQFVGMLSSDREHAVARQQFPHNPKTIYRIHVIPKGGNHGREIG